MQTWIYNWHKKWQYLNLLQNKKNPNTGNTYNVYRWQNARVNLLTLEVTVDLDGIQFNTSIRINPVVPWTYENRQNCKMFFVIRFIWFRISAFKFRQQFMFCKDLQKWEIRAKDFSYLYLTMTLFYKVCVQCVFQDDF